MWQRVHPDLQQGISSGHIGNGGQPLSADSSCTVHFHLPATCSVESACKETQNSVATTAKRIEINCDSSQSKVSGCELHG
jgi:hypothetical protein